MKRMLLPSFLFILSFANMHAQKTPAPEDVWRQIFLPENKAQMSAVAWENKVYFAGGYRGETFLATINIYNITTGTWTEETLSEARSFPTAIAAEGKIFFAGGVTQTIPYNDFSDRLDIYDVEQDEWTYLFLSEPKNTLNQAVHVGNKIMFPGGGTNGFMLYSSWKIRLK